VDPRFPTQEGGAAWVAGADAELEQDAVGRELTVADCDGVGGLNHALSQHADQALAELDERQKSIAETLFRLLSERTPGNRDIRRPTAAGEAAELAGASLDELVAVVEVFRAPGRSFIVPPVPEPIDANRILDITHESLIRQWDRLRNWAEEEEKSANIYRRLAETASLWRQGESALWQSPDLEVALDWQKKERPTALWAKRYGGDFALATTFLAASKAARDARESGSSPPPGGFSDIRPEGPLRPRPALLGAMGLLEPGAPGGSGGCRRQMHAAQRSPHNPPERTGRFSPA
jgi:hypothetical protein